MPDPWVEEAQQFKPAGGAPPPAPAANDDWKIWQATSSAAPTDDRNLFQKIRDFPGEGVNRAISGVKELVHDPSMHAAHEIAAGVGQAAAPFALPALVAAPAATLLGGAGALVGGSVGKIGSTLLGADEDTSNVASDVGGLVGGGLASRVPGAVGPLVRGARAMADNPTVRDLAGFLVSPRLPHGLSLISRGGRVVDALRGAFGSAPEEGQLGRTLSYDSGQPPNPSPYKMGQPAPFRPKALIGSGPIVTPPPADTSGSHTVSDLYPANRMAQRALPAAQQIIDIKPEPATPAGEDDSKFLEQYRKAVSFPRAGPRDLGIAPDQPLLKTEGTPSPASRLIQTGEPSPLARPGARENAAKLFEAAKESGTVPDSAKPGEPLGSSEEPSPEPFIARARAARGLGASTLADLFHKTGIPSADLVNMGPTDWQAVSKAAGVEFPLGGRARAKLIRDTGAQLRALEGSSTPVAGPSQKSNALVQERATIAPNAQSRPNASQRRAEGPGEPIPGPRKPTNPTAPGAQTSIRVPGTDRAYQAQYTVRELDDVHASHNPYSFQKNPNYQLTNDRNYADPANSERIVRQAKQFDPEYLLTESPDAGNGAPVITEDGNVLGGNSRTMTLQRVYQDHPAAAQAYRQGILQRAQQYGLDPGQVANMKRPVLVREIPNSEWDRLATDQQHAVTDFNKTGTATLTAAERATADARNLSPELADYIGHHIEATGPNATLADALSGRRGAEIINKLTEEGLFTPQEKPQLIDSKTGAITTQAKERIGKMLTGQLFRDSEQFARTPPELRNKLERTVAPLMQVQGRPEWDLIPEVRDAIDILEYARAHGLTKLSDLTAQESMFGGGPEYSERALAIADAIKNETPTALSKKFKEYAIGSRGSMFGDSDPDEVFADLFGSKTEGE